MEELLIEKKRGKREKKERERERKKEEKKGEKKEKRERGEGEKAEAASGKSDRTEVRANIFSSSCPVSGRGSGYRAAIATSTRQIECVSVECNTQVISFDIQFVHPATVFITVASARRSIYLPPTGLFFAFVYSTPPRQKSSSSSSSSIILIIIISDYPARKYIFYRVSS